VIKQIFNINLNVPATQGWCLKYVDDAIAAPARTSPAQVAYKNEYNAGRMHYKEDLPTGVFVIIFFEILNGPDKDNGHVALAKRIDANTIEIHDSEVHSGQRGIYGSVGEVQNWFASKYGYSLKYLGWSYSCDGRTIAADVKIERVITRTTSHEVNVRDFPSKAGKIRTVFPKGKMFNVKGYVDGEFIDGNKIWFVTKEEGWFVNANYVTDKTLKELPDITKSVVPAGMTFTPPKTQSASQKAPEPPKQPQGSNDDLTETDRELIKKFISWLKSTKKEIK
jgi:hypothetical protein